MQFPGAYNFTPVAACIFLWILFPLEITLQIYMKMFLLANIFHGKIIFFENILQYRITEKVPE